MNSSLHDLSSQTELALLGKAARQQLIALIEPEANLNGSRVLAQQSGVEDGLACRMLAGLCDGLRAS
jgi:hypothetical protein